MSRLLPTFVAVALLAAPAVAQDLRPALEAAVRFRAAGGADLLEIAPGRPFRIELGFRAAVGEVPDALRPMGWLRQPSPTDLPCGEAAAAYRGAGRGAAAGVDLNGAVIGMLTEDDGFTITDPGRSVGSANQLAAHRFENRPAAMAVDPEAAEFLFTDPVAGEVIAVNGLGAARVVAAGLNRPGALLSAASGGAWLVEEGSGDLLRLYPDGATARRAPDVRRLFPVDPSATGGRVAALTGAGAATRLLVLNDDGTDRLAIPAPGALDAGLTADAALWLAGDGLHVAWLDAPERPQAIPLDGRFDALAVSPEGRIAVIFSRTLTGFGLVDLAIGRLAQAGDTDAPIAEVAFLPGAAVLRLANQSAAGVIDLALVRPDREAVVGPVRLGPPAADPGSALLARLLPEPAMLAVHGPSYTGFVIDRRNAVSGKPPMEAVRLRGGIPRSVAALDRGFRPEGPGRFAATTQLPRPGDWELVVSAGIGQMAFCARVPATPAPETGAVTGPGLVRAERADPGRIRLRLTAAGDAPAAGIEGQVAFSALVGNWRTRRPFATDADGRTLESYPVAGGLPIVVEVQAQSRQAFLPLVLEDIE